MKRQVLKSIAAFCMSVMTFGAASSLVVSCYDDAPLWEELEGVQNQLTELDQKIEAVKSQLEALVAKVDVLYTLQFQVTATNELQYSFDGETWVSTGINLAEECEAPCECPGVSLVDNGDSVTITVGDQSYTIVKPIEIAFEIRAGKVYFESEGTMTIGIKSEGVEDVTVMSAPKGWWAEVTSEGKLEITAPNYSDTQGGYGWDEDDNYYETAAKYAQSGYVKVHACGVDGTCFVGKLSVEVAKQALVVKAYAGNAYFTLAGTASYWNPTFFYGLSTKESLEADTADLIERLNDGDYDVYDDYENNMEEAEVVVAIEDLLGEEPQVGDEYVVWALLENNSSSYSYENIVYTYYSPVDVKITEDAAKNTPYNVEVTVNVLGADSYVAVAMPELQLQWTSVEDIQEQMAMAMAEGMAYGKLYTTSYTGSALDIAAGTSYSMSGNYAPASDVYVFVLPIDSRANDEYTAEDVVYAKFTTAELAAGGSIDVEAKQITSYMGEVYDYDIWDYVEALIELDPYTQLGVEVNLSSTSDWAAFYYDWVDDATFKGALFEGDEEMVVEYLLENTYGNYPADVKSWPLYLTTTTSPNTTMHFVAFVVDAAGKYSKIAHVEATSKELVKADLVWADPVETNVVDGVLKNTQTLKVTPAFEGGKEAASYKYVLAQTKYYNQYEGMTDDEMAEELYFSTSSSVKTVTAEELVNGVLYVDGHSYGYPYYFAIVPIDAEGNPGASALILEYETVFALDAAVTEGKEFEATKPAITLNLPPVEEFYPDGGWGDAAYYGYEDQTEWGYGYHYYYEIGFAVTPVKGTEVKIQYVDTKSYTLSDDAAVNAGKLWSESLGFGCVTATEYKESAYKYLSHYWDEPAPAVVLCVSWKDAEGTVYYMDVDVQPELQKLADKMTAMIGGETEAELSVDAKQWVFAWEEMDVDALLDFGVAAEDYFYLAYDATAYGMPGYVEYIGSEYSVTAEDATSGVITLVTYNMFGEEITMDIEYSELTATTCHFECLEIGIDCDAELSDEVLPVTPNGVAM